jgi:hypothetical protein
MAAAIVDWNNIARLKERCRLAFDEINASGDLVKTRLQPQYLDLKLTELELIHEIKQQKDKIKEEEREAKRIAREAEREEARVKAAAEKAKREREEMELMVKRELEKLDSASPEQLLLIEKHRAQLEVLKQKENRAMSMAQLTRAGYVYVITNKASFGEGVCKVGMTRRVEPRDRVKELGDASVPEFFDVHAFVYSEDAPSLERFVHEKLDEKRVNLINRRKEFFFVEPESVVRLMKGYDGELEFNIIA